MIGTAPLAKENLIHSIPSKFNSIQFISLVSHNKTIQAQLELFKTDTKSKQLASAQKFISVWRNKLIVLTMNAWTMYVVTQRKSKAAMVRFVIRWRNASLFHTLITWTNFTRESKRIKHITRMYASKLRNSLITQSYNTLIEFAKTRKFLRRICNKMVNSVMMGGLQVGFSSWARVVRQMKEVERIEEEVSVVLGVCTCREKSLKKSPFCVGSQPAA